MTNKTNLSNITKLLEKLFKAGFTDEKKILAIELKDLEKIEDITSNEIVILLNLKKAIRQKNVIAFLNGTKERKDENV